MEKALCIPSILAAKIKEREQAKGIVFTGSPSTTISDGVRLIRKGMKNYLKGEEKDVMRFILDEPSHIQNLIVTMNRR